MANKLECRIYRRRKDMDKLRSSGGTTFSNVFAENPWWRELVDDYRRAGAAREALVEPAGDEGVTWDDAATDLVVTETMGYPYFLQQFGQETWNEAPASTRRFISHG